MKNEDKKKIEELRKKINYHNTLYYEGKPEISDYKFDRLLEDLRSLEAKYPNFQNINSPTQKVGEHISKNFKSERHYHPMLSLSNSYSKEEIEKFITRIYKNIPNEKISFFCELKFDGTAISIIYKNCILERVVTRGDGTKGDNITKNALILSNIPHYIKKIQFFNHQKL